MIFAPAVTLESASREFCTVKIFSGDRWVRTKHYPLALSYTCASRGVSGTYTLAVLLPSVWRGAKWALCCLGPALIHCFCDRQELWAVQADVRSVLRGPGLCRDVSLHQREGAAWLQQSQHTTRTPQATLLMNAVCLRTTLARVPVALQLLTDLLTPTFPCRQTSQKCPVNQHQIAYITCILNSDCGLLRFDAVR